jgi:hypothetical protein
MPRLRLRSTYLARNHQCLKVNFFSPPGPLISATSETYLLFIMVSRHVSRRTRGGKPSHEGYWQWGPHRVCHAVPVIS